MVSSYFLVDLIILIFLIALIVVTGITIHLTINAINRIRESDRDENLKRALRFLTWAIAIHWISAVGLVIFAFLYVFYVKRIQAYIITVIEAVIAITYFLSAIFILLAVGDIQKSLAYQQGRKEAREAVQLGHLAASISIITGLAVITWGFILTHQYRLGEAGVGLPFGLEAAEETKKLAG